MEEESSIYKSLEGKGKLKVNNENNYNYTSTQEKIKSQTKNNNQSRLFNQPSKAQIYHYEKTIHELSNKNLELNAQIEKLILQIEKSKAIIDNHQTEIRILKD